MKAYPARIVSLAMFAALLAPFALRAQTVPAASPPEETVTLSAFEVKSAKDTAYRVQNSVATTGIAQSLFKTPLPITVVTGEFMRDAGLTGFTGAVSYVSSVAIDPFAADGNTPPGVGRSQPNLNRFRGQPINGTFRNGLRQFYGFDTENIDRIEVAKGPLAVFIGGATLGGEVNLVTKKPQFARSAELSATVASHHSFAFAADATGPIDAKKTLAYRVIASYRDGNTWRDFSHSRVTYIEPQLLWRPNAKLTIRLDYAHRLLKGNNVSQNVSDTGNFSADFDKPRQVLLDLGKLRTGALAGVPFTVDEYKNRIGQAFGTWRQDVFDATGKWVQLGTGLALNEGNFADGRRYNTYGPYAPVTIRTDLLENEWTLAATEWLQLRFLGRYLKTYNAQDYFSFSQRLVPAGNYSLTNGYQGARIHDQNHEAKLEAVLKHKFGFIEPTLLVGGQYGDSKNYSEAAIFNYSALPAVPASPNVFASPNPLTGANIYTYWDPRAQAQPDNRLVTFWPSQINAPGTKAYDQTKTNTRAAYAAGSLGFWDDRVILTAGARRGWAHSINSTLDRNLASLSGNSTDNPYANNTTFGGIVRLANGLNAYASLNKGETVRTGSLVSRVTFGTPAPPLDIVSAAEQAANPVPNDKGEGREVGLKFELLDRQLTGSVGWFQLTRGNILVTDNGRNAADPRNKGTEVDPNPATADPGRRLQVNWVGPIDGNTTKGFETDLLWTPTPSYSVVFAASHLYTNKQTVIKPATADQATQRTYALLNGKPLVNSPDNTLRVFQNYRLTQGALRGASVGLGIRYQSSEQPAADDTNWGLVFPAWTVVDLQLGYATKISARPVNFQLGVTNLTNRSYATGNRVYGAPREFSLTTRVAF